MSSRGPTGTRREGIGYAIAWFIAGAVIVGGPIAYLVGVHWFIGTTVVGACGLLAVRYGETFFHRVADSDWWRVLGGGR